MPFNDPRASKNKDGNLSIEDYRLTMDVLISRAFQIQCVNIPSMVAETAYHRHFQDIYQFRSRTFRHRWNKPITLLHSLPATFSPLSFTVRAPRSGFMTVETMTLGGATENIFNSSDLTVVFLRNAHVTERGLGDFIGKEIKDLVSSAGDDDRRVINARQTVSGGHRGVALSIEPNLETFSAQGITFHPRLFERSPTGGFTDINGQHWASLNELCSSTIKSASCRTYSRPLIHLHRIEMETFGGKTEQVIAIRPEANIRRPIIHLAGSQFDYSRNAWLLPCNQIRPGELLANTRAASRIEIIE